MPSNERDSRPKTVCLRADASAAIGAGHVVRCLTLADALRSHGATCIFLSRPETLETVPTLATSGHRIVVVEGAEVDPATVAARVGAVDWLVVDHYRLDHRFEAPFRRRGCRVMVIDDLADRPHACDLLLDQTLGRVEEDYAGLVPASARLLLGPSFALLRDQFAKARPAALAARAGRPVERVMVMMGGADPHLVSLRALQAIENTGRTLKVDVVAGAQDPARPALEGFAADSSLDVQLHFGVRDVASLMARADLAIGAAGTSTWERCCLGLPALVVIAAENQSTIARRTEAAGACRILGAIDDISPGAIARGISDLLQRSGALDAMSRSAAAICDGRGGWRTVAAMGQRASYDDDG